MKRNYLSVTKINSPVVNSFYEDKKAYIIKKSSGETVEVKPPAPVCTSGSAHKSLSCNSCHSSWTPQCIGCHTEFNKNGTMYDLLANKESKGEWLEYPKDYLVEPAVLGIREIRADGKIKRSVEEFIPGMVLTVTSGSKHNGTIFKRLYAPAFSHTIRKQARSCVSCHNNPAALGYGRGKLEYRVTGNSGRWIFTSQYTLVKNDGLPGDAWIGFLKEKGNNSTTRDNTRSFSVEEQKRILTVGACLTCHKQDSGIITKSLIDFNFVFLRRSKNCKIPDWKLN
jgi:cytochrome c553